MSAAVRPLRREDVGRCAAVHREAFPGFFLSELGEPFLRQFYRFFVDAPDAVSAVATEQDGRVVGVVVGTTAPRGFFRRMLVRRWWAFALASLGAVRQRPRRLRRLLRAVRYRGGTPVEVSGALLSSICVEPGARPATGRALLDAFVRAIEERGVRSAYLTTDADDNDRVNGFYTAAGWRLAGTFSTPEGRRMNCYRWTCSTGQPRSVRRGTGR